MNKTMPFAKNNKEKKTEILAVYHQPVEGQLFANRQLGVYIGMFA
jgi:hypothetical protein